MNNAIERAVWTSVQTALAILTVSGLTTLDASAAQLLLSAVVAAILSFLKTVAQERLSAIDVS